MTREEAIKLLTQYIDYDAETPDYYEMEKACKVALKVLKQEPCEDCISRAEAIKAVREAYSIYIPRMNGWEKGLPLKIDKAIYDLPSVQPISKSVIEDIKADIAEFMAKIPALGNCKEGWHNAGQRIGLEQACEIIDNHIAESEE